MIVGTVIAVAAVPRAIFMLLGGAVVDRWSPRLVMLLSNLVRMGLVAVLAVTTWQETITIGLIYGVAVLFGLADAFMFPAASAFPPRLLPPERLAAGNSLFQGTAQLTLILGPLLAGGVIVLFGGEVAPGAGVSAAGVGAAGIEDALGLAMVFALDTLTFVVPLGILLLIRDRFPPERSVDVAVWAALVEGVRYTWNDIPLRTFVLMLVALSLFFRGPFVVGIPAFADAALPEGAAAFGIIMSALGIGAIIGTVLAGITRHPPPAKLGLVLLVDFFAFGVVFIFMTQFPNTYFAAAGILLAAIIDGYIIVLLITWIQKRVAKEKMGRVMSVIMMASQGLFPISAAAAGALAGWDVTGMLLGAGCVMVGITALGLLVPTVRRMGHGPDPG